jgi:hypothetical protein
LHRNKTKDNGFILASGKSRKGDRYIVAIAFPVLENVIKIRYEEQVKDIENKTTKSLVSNFVN